MAQCDIDKMPILALLFFFSTFLACTCLYLVIYSIEKLAYIIHEGPEPLEVLWAVMGIASLVLSALASIFFTIASCFLIINRKLKISPAPTVVHGEHPAAIVELQHP